MYSLICCNDQMLLPMSSHRTARHFMQKQPQHQKPRTARRFIQNNRRQSQEKAIQSHVKSHLNSANQTETGDDYSSISEEWMLRIDAVYTELEDELIQFKNLQNIRTQSIFQRQQTSEHLTHFRLTRLMAKTNYIASKIKSTLAEDRHSLTGGGQNLKCTPKFNDCWHQLMSGDIAARISLALVDDQ